MVAYGQLRLNGLHRGPDFINHRSGLNGPRQVSAYRNRGKTVITPADAIFNLQFDMGDLRQRDGIAIGQMYKQFFDILEFLPLAPF